MTTMRAFKIKSFEAKTVVPELLPIYCIQQSYFRLLHSEIVHTHAVISLFLSPRKLLYNELHPTIPLHFSSALFFQTHPGRMV